MNRSYGGGGAAFISASSSRSDWITERLFSIAFVAFRPSAAWPGTPVIRTLNQSTPTWEVVMAAPNGSATTAASAV